MKTFRCPECEYESCPECAEASHTPLNCEEAKAKRVDQVRLKMEEDMTAAVLRKCPNPNCDRSMIKKDGCNKLTCTCGCLMCNVCKARINGYNHFCQQFDCNHKKCGKCSLWANTDTDDKRKIDDIERKAKEDIKRKRLAVAAKIATKENPERERLATTAKPKTTAAVLAVPRREKKELKRLKLLRFLRRKQK